MLNPYAILASFAVFVLSVSGAYVYGRRDGQSLEEGRQLSVNAAIEEAARIVSQATAEAIAKQKPISQTINRKVETVVREVPVYRDCISDPAVERLLDDARAGRAPTESASDSVVPGSGRGPAP